MLGRTTTNLFPFSDLDISSVQITNSGVGFTYVNQAGDFVMNIDGTTRTVTVQNFTVLGSGSMSYSSFAVDPGLPGYTFSLGGAGSNMWYNTVDSSISFRVGYSSTIFKVQSSGATATRYFADPGLVNAPAYTFTTDNSTGLYYDSGTSTIRFSFAGTSRATISTAGLLTTTTFLGDVGTGTNPTYSFSADTGTGIYRSAVNTLSIATNTTQRFSVSTTNISCTLPILEASGTVGAPAYAFTANSASGIYAGTTSQVNVSANGVEVVRAVNTAGAGQLQGINGTAAAPTFSFINSTTSGLYSAGTDQMNISIGGSERFRFLTTQIQAFGSGGLSGSAAAPIYTFTSSTNTGMYSGGAGTISFSTTGTLRVTLDTNNFTCTLPFIGPNGAVGAPSYAFASNSASGIYAGSSSQVNVSANGVEVVRAVNTAGAGQLQGINGTAAAPIFSFINSTSTGLYSALANQMNISIAGSEKFRFTSGGQLAGVGTAGATGTPAAPTYTFTTASTTGLYSSAAGTLNITTAGVLRVTLNSTNLTSTLPFIGPVGAVGAPTFAFTGSTSTGIYSSAANNLSFSANGTQVFNATSSQVSLMISGTAKQTVATGSITNTVPLIVPAGTVSAPSVTISGSTTTGMYSSATDQLSFSAGGTQVFNAVSTQVDLMISGVSKSAITSTKITNSVPTLGPDGTVAAPSYAYTNESGTGSYRIGTGNQGLACTGTLVLDLLPTRITSPIQPYWQGFVNGSTQSLASGTTASVVTSVFTESKRVGFAAMSAGVLTVPVAGYYMVSGTLAFDGKSSTGMRALIIIAANNGNIAPDTISATWVAGASVNFNTVLSGCGILYMQANAQIQMTAFQNSGSVMNVGDVSGTADLPIDQRFSVRMIV